MWGLIAFAIAIALIAINVLKRVHKARLGPGDSREFILGDNLIGLNILLIIGFFGALFAANFNKMFFYAEPGYVYHIRTFSGDERIVDGIKKTGYTWYGFGRKNAWKRALSVQSMMTMHNRRNSNAEGESNEVSAPLPAINITFLDQVTADVGASVRFRLPSDDDAFLRMAREYRNPDNLLRSALVPAFKETLQATASLMTAEEYYAGERTTFINDFEDQMRNGTFHVKRYKISETDASESMSSANATKKADQENYGDRRKIVYRVKRLQDETGNFKRKPQSFVKFGISVVDARIPDLKPNKKFLRRMESKQEASANRAIARERQEEEVQNRLLEIERGKRQIEQVKTQALKQQMERTTRAETDNAERTTKARTEKELALIVASRQKEQAAIEAETAKIRLEMAKIEAESVKVKAEADAFAKKAALEADNALREKLQAEIEIQRVWAAAYARRNVPQYVFGGGGNGGTPVGQDGEASTFMKMMTMQAAKSLAYDREITQEQKPTSNRRGR